MNTEIMKHRKPVGIISEMSCPYNGFTVCLASLSSMMLDSQKKEMCCCTENYDDCPLFLAKVLRR